MEICSIEQDVLVSKDFEKKETKAIQDHIQNINEPKSLESILESLVEAGTSSQTLSE